MKYYDYVAEYAVLGKSKAVGTGAVSHAMRGWWGLVTLLVLLLGGLVLHGVAAHSGPSIQFTAVQGAATVGTGLTADLIWGPDLENEA